MLWSQPDGRRVTTSVIEDMGVADFGQRLRRRALDDDRPRRSSFPPWSAENSGGMVTDQVKSSAAERLCANPGHRTAPDVFPIAAGPVLSQRRIVSGLGDALVCSIMAAALRASFEIAAANAQREPFAQVQEVDARFHKAVIQGDANKLERIVADDAKIIHGYHGGIQSKEKLINEFRSYHIEKYDRTPIYTNVNGNSAFWSRSRTSSCMAIRSTQRRRRCSFGDPANGKFSSYRTLITRQAGRSKVGR